MPKVLDLWWPGADVVNELTQWFSEFGLED
jgi:hypothetical protein